VRVGLFGGTFDPPHVGHLLAAVDAYEALSLDRLIFVPAAVQPLKVGQVTAGPDARLAMVRLLVEGDARFGVDPIEIARTGLSYTVDTLRSYAEREPGAERFLLVGADVLASFDRWREPDEVLRLARLAILTRAGEGLSAKPPAGAITLATRRVDVSSTEIRARVRAGKSIRGFVPEGVAVYVATAGLYR
jgi:nicotinate-nucleotide adenylyltransferase